jgi:hypothetical protein
MQVKGRIFQSRVTHQQLDGSRIRSGLQQLRGEGMPEGVWSNLSSDAGTACGFSHSPPDDLVRHGRFHTALAGGAWKQINLGFLPTPILAQSFKQFGTERDIPIPRAFALRLLSMSATFSSESSVRRTPVP